jgi:DNA repair photolyase
MADSGLIFKTSPFYGKRSFMADITRHYTDVKKVLSRSDFANPFVPSTVKFSPYRACEHACKYCDGRAEKYYVEGNFERDIVVRRNLAQLLKEELTKLREPAIVSIGSGVSDPYQPVECDEMLMAQSAAILDSMSIPATVMTKSALPLRDIEVWSSLNKKKQFFLIVSLTTLDDSIRRTFEPYASPVDERLNMLRKFKAAGCRVGVLAMPLLPHITDTGENVHALWKELAAIGVDFIKIGGLTLRPGVQKDTFMETLRCYSPELVSEYIPIYRENRQSGAPAADYFNKAFRNYGTLSQEYGIAAEIPHATYRNLLPTYDELFLLLSHMVSLYRNIGVNTTRLETSLNRYVTWFTEYKKVFNRHRSQKYTELEDLVRESCRNGTMETVLANRKLADFVAQVVLERRVFDYVKLAFTAQ